MLGCVGDVNENPDQVVAEGLTFDAPMPTDRLGLSGDGPEALFELDQRVREQVVGNRRAVMEPQGRQRLETPERFAHKWLDPQP